MVKTFVDLRGQFFLPLRFTKYSQRNSKDFYNILDMYRNFKEHLDTVLSEIREAGLYKNERVIISPQGAEITLATGQKVLNFCANNYLGLSNNSQLIEAAKASLDDHGYGMSSVRFICGTTDL